MQFLGRTAWDRRRLALQVTTAPQASSCRRDAAVPGFKQLRGLRFDDRSREVGRSDSQQLETGGCEQLLKLRGGSFLAAGHHQHVYVEELREVRLVSFGHDGLHDNQ